MQILLGVGMPRLPRFKDHLCDPGITPIWLAAKPTDRRYPHADGHRISFAERLKNIQPHIFCRSRQPRRQLRLITRDGKLREDDHFRLHPGRQLDEPEMRFDIPQNISLEWSGLSYADPHAPNISQLSGFCCPDEHQLPVCFPMDEVEEMLQLRPAVGRIGPLLLPVPADQYHRIP